MDTNGSIPGSNGGSPGNGRDSVPPALTGWRQTFSSLHGNPDFRNLFIGNIGFFFGMNMMIILRGWLVQDKWDNAAYLGFIMAAVAIPMLLISPIAGVVTDRVDRRKLLIVAQSVLVVINGFVAVMIITDVIQFWHLLIISSMTGAAFAFNMPGRQALVATLVPRERLMNATALSTAMMNVHEKPIGMSISEAAIEAGVSESTLYGLANQGRLPGARRVGKRIIVHRETFETWLRDGMGR